MGEELQGHTGIRGEASSITDDGEALLEVQGDEEAEQGDEEDEGQTHGKEPKAAGNSVGSGISALVLHLYRHFFSLYVPSHAWHVRYCPDSRRSATRLAPALFKFLSHTPVSDAHGQAIE